MVALSSEAGGVGEKFVSFPYLELFVNPNVSFFSVLK
jgi:hypothetical protein